MKTTFIYALCEPGTRTVRYIGKANNPKKRLISHLRYSSIKADTYLGRWLRTLVSRPPELLILAEVPRDSWEEEEVRYINSARVLGFRLTNGTDGGDCGPVMLGKAHPMFGKPNPNKGVSRPIEICKKISLSLLGNQNRLGDKASAETRAKQSAALSGEKNPMFGKPAYNRGVPSPNKGVPLPAKTKAKMSEAHLGEKNPMFGRPWTPEHRENVRVAKLRNKERDQEIEWALVPYTLE